MASRMLAGALSRSQPRALRWRASAPATEKCRSTKASTRPRRLSKYCCAAAATVSRASSAVRWTRGGPDPSWSVIARKRTSVSSINVIDELRRTPGVGDANLFGASDYSMRIWLKPDKVAQYNLTPSDIAAAVREQNAQFAAGRFGEEPMAGVQAFTYSVTTPGRLADPREFENIILHSTPDGGALRLKDVARVELGSLNYSTVSTLNGAPAVPIGVYLQPGANASPTPSRSRTTSGPPWTGC